MREMKYQDYYKILGISRQASQDEIKRAYRKLARKYHPDVSKEPEAEKQFKEIGEAYEVLKDPEKRAAYDQLGTRWQAGDHFQPPPGWHFNFDFGGDGFGNNGFHRANPFDFSDFFETMFGDGGPTKNGRYTHSHPFHTPGDDQHAKITITLEEAFRGTTRAIQIQVPERIGSGQLQMKTRTLNVKIPAGVVEGQQIRLSGQGLASNNGGVNGHLFLEIEFQPDDRFRVEGRDIYLTLPVTPWEAALGSTVAVPTLGGKVELKIPTNSQAGQRLRLKGRGLSGNPPGDQYVILQIVTPKANSETAKAFYRQMAQQFSFDPRAELV
jgi:curved DNA-binding protein